ncbi:myeloperoxidase-like [Alligator mississippiensis]|uniref:myeloperoxidase-like n=1 Tax=Alligator mississippiensis TaxID=8496 RepID=UPI002877649E|nr:myeloperoxidase-like [Alligator mississippiensis]
MADIGGTDIPEVLSAPAILSSVNEAKQLVDAAYKHARKRSKQALEEDKVNPSDFLKHLTEPVAGTRSAIRSADYMETTLSLLKKKLQQNMKRPFNITDLLDGEQKATISKATGCKYQICPIKCAETSSYRTITGECNNRKHPHLGASNHGFARLLPAEYEDGISLPKGVTEGKLYNGFVLPLVRNVSSKIAHTANENITHDQERSLFFMQWGQWVDHDLDLAPAAGEGHNSKTINCETSCTYQSPCFPIKFPSDDPRFQSSNICMPLTRSAPACNPRTFIREQINAITSFIDASMVYGNEVPLARYLRNQTNQLGLMAVNQKFTDAGLELLPFENKTKSICTFTNKTANIPCFKAGDARAPENLGLSALHTLFLREHNRLAAELRKLNCHWDGEKLYQEARKIIGAMTQIITYRDYLPRVFGDEKEKWVPLYSGYNESVDPTVTNVFSLAFRFGHSSVQPFVSRLNEDFQPSSSYPRVPLHLTFCASWRIVMEGGIDPLLRGLLVDHAKLMKQSQMVVVELQERLFEQKEVMGLDLPAINMQRGRDHGLPGYNAWRRFCGLSEPHNLDELAHVLGNQNMAKKFLDLYGTPDNIDIWIGALAEPFVPQGRVGPLLACIFGVQFRNLRDGDRFWWENPGVFTLQQRRALSIISLSRVICDNTRIRMVPRDVFKVNSYPWDFVNCSKIDSLDLSSWKEESHSGPEGRVDPPISLAFCLHVSPTHSLEIDIAK